MKVYILRDLFYSEWLGVKIQRLADKNFQLLKDDPRHPSLHFKPFWNVIGIHYRALGFDHEGGVLWFWIDSHAEYDKMMP